MIKLHQMLHGYKLGHNYIQGSIILPSTHDMDKIATLSDWSEYVGVDNMRDYISVYPLEESPYYIVAKTWYADEMRRPGCVWTHSLLIHKEDLVKITDFCNLLFLFEKPLNVEFEFYSSPLEFVEEEVKSKSQLSQLGVNEVAEVYESLLSDTPVFILTEFTSRQSQELLLSLLNYIPVEILKNKSLCSGTAAPRSYDNHYLSLQFVTHDGNAVKYLSNKSAAPWSQLVGVSISNNNLQVARLIKNYQDELGDNIGKLKGLLSVIALINCTCKDEEEKHRILLMIIDTLTKYFPSQEDGNVFKSTVFQPSLVGDLGGEESFLYTISTVDVSSFTKEQIKYQERLHELSTDQFLRLLKQLYTSENLNDWGLQAVNEVAHFISYADISGLRKTDRAFFHTIISSSSELLNQIVWHDFSREDLQSILSMFSDKDVVVAFKHWRELFRTMLTQKVPVARELARMVFSHEESCVGEYMNYLNGTGCLQQMSVSIELEDYPVAVLTWLSNVTSINYDVACVLINTIDEVSLLVKNWGSRIWMPLYNLLDEEALVQYYVFLYRLSFNWQDKEAFAYLRKAFYPIHSLLAQDKLDYNLWFRVEPYTEHLLWILNWDRCKKMRKMVIRRLKDAGYSKSEVANYTPDPQTNEWLVGEW